MSNSDRQGRRGLLLVISSPSGAGKTSLSRRLVAEHTGLALSVSATTLWLLTPMCGKFMMSRPASTHAFLSMFVMSLSCSS